MDRSFMHKFGILAAVALCMATHLRAEPRIDFNGDGYADLAVGVPDEDDAKTTDAGAVNIIYGSASGLTEVGNTFFTQRTKGVPGNRQKGANFGKALAAGDFNDDGFTDLAVGAPFYNQPHLPGAGYVVIFHGASKGLSGSRTNGLIWLDSLARDSNFGAALAAGDFDFDGIDDIAVGAPEFWRDQEITPGSGHGAVLVWHGSRFGMEGMQFWRQGEDGLGETSEFRDQFGAALAAADFDGDGADDLAVGAPGEETLDYLPIGAVSVLFGQAGTGLTAAGNEIWTQTNDGGGNAAEAGDRYGNSLGSGDINGDGCDELVVGALGDHSVHVIYGTSKGLTSQKTQELSAPMPDFVSADFDANGADDLAIRGGGVRVYFADSDGLPIWPKYLDQFLMPGLNQGDDSQESTARVGHALAADDFEGRGSFDLAIGIPDYDIPFKHNLLAITNAGAVAVFRNTPIVQHSDPMSETPIIQWSRSLDFFEGNYPSTIHEVFGVAERGDGFGKVFAH